LFDVNEALRRLGDQVMADRVRRDRLVAIEGREPFIAAVLELASTMDLPIDRHDIEVALAAARTKQRSQWV